MANKPWDVKHQAFRAALKELRVNKNLVQEEMGKQLGKKQSYVSKYETGERKLGYIELLDILEVTEHSVQEFHALYLIKVNQQPIDKNNFSSYTKKHQ